MFFWYVPTIAQSTTPENIPVILWLNGGPGASSLFGAFGELGPYKLGPDADLSRNKHSWIKFAHMLFIDNPVGTGFSFTRSKDGYSTNQTHYGHNLYETLVQFFKLFPNLQGNPLIISGASYAGKYVPALGYTIHKNNPTADLKLNLQGLAIGNGWVDPINMLNFGDILHPNGLLDINGYRQFTRIRNKVQELIRQKQFREAYDYYDLWILGDTTPYPTLYNNLTGLNNYFNFMKVGKLKAGGKTVPQKWIDFFHTKGYAANFNVGDQRFQRPIIVAESLREDILNTVADSLAVLMENYRVLIYNGLLDVKCGYALTENYLNKLKWKGSQDFKEAVRHHWYVKGKLAGYWKKTGKFVQLAVRDSGHSVPKDKPFWAEVMMNTFANNLPFESNPNSKSKGRKHQSK
uniref:Venom serine carboxypeptidase n=1 Tax=Lygus hesperus TaxID=30085 RepID=A0A0A9XBU1_LYGHE